jgi:hypothetical protein
MTGHWPALGAVVVSSAAPGRAVAWYRRALELAGGNGVLRAGRVELRFRHQPDVAPTAAEPMRCILNFVVDDILAVEARLVAMETIWVRELEHTSCGVIGTVLDPDGNCVQIIETSSGVRADGERGGATRHA